MRGEFGRGFCSLRPFHRPSVRSAFTTCVVIASQTSMYDPISGPGEKWGGGTGDDNWVGWGSTGVGWAAGTGWVTGIGWAAGIGLGPACVDWTAGVGCGLCVEARAAS